MNSSFLKQLNQDLDKVPRKITLVAVTKSVGVEETNEVIKAGVQTIGENRVEDFEKKIPQLLPVETHFIGQIQSRKMKRIVELFDVIQSVSSVEYLEKIENEASAQKKPIKVLLQFNISGEGQKGGFAFDAVGEIIKAVPAVKFAKITGVMGMAEDTGNAEIAREQFRLLKNIRDQLRAQFPDIVEISMGMSNDYKIALEEGATMLRIGRALFKD